MKISLMFTIIYCCVIMLLLGSSHNVLAERDRPGSAGQYSPCPIESAVEHRFLQEFLFPPAGTPVWQDDRFGSPIKELEEQSRSHVAQRLTGSRDTHICEKLNRLHERELNAEYTGTVRGRDGTYFMYGAGYFKIGDVLIVAFVQNPPPQPENPDEIRVRTGRNLVFVYDLELNRLGGFSL
jgi:hypothetical protein